MTNNKVKNLCWIWHCVAAINLFKNNNVDHARIKSDKVIEDHEKKNKSKADHGIDCIILELNSECLAKKQSTCESGRCMRHINNRKDHNAQ